jgi:pyruvate,water dikinase
MDGNAAMKLRLASWMDRFRRRKIQPDVVDADALRTAFKSRYQQFRRLLGANNKALELMSELEQAQAGSAIFGMTFVRSRCTLISASVFQMVKHLMELSDGRYAVLLERFRWIQGQISAQLQHRPTTVQGPLVMDFNTIDKQTADAVGPKMANLGEIINRLKLPAPNGFAVTTAGYQRFIDANDLQPEIDRRIQAADPQRPEQLHGLAAELQQLIISARLPDELRGDLDRHSQCLGDAQATFALRSSALGEDVADTSFAGQYLSLLNISREHLAEAYREIVASKYSLAAMTYRLNRGIRDEDVAMCVGCLQMIQARCGGVVYTRNPVNIRDNVVVIHSAWGLPKAVVDGSAAADMFVVARNGTLRLVRRQIADKTTRFVCDAAEGVCRLETVAEEARQPSLSDNQALALAAMCLKIESHYGVAQDVEWAMDGSGRFLVLQCRPLKQSARTLRQGAVFEEGKKLPEAIVQGGVTASPGVAAGPVFLVRKDMDALQFPVQAVLVTHQALPRWASLLGRAAAVVTEQGNLAGHLANVAREFGVPAVFGLAQACRLLENQSLVTVDADTCRIYSGKVAELLDLSPAKPQLMSGSPVFRLLQGVAQCVLPLNLIDPDAPSFRADQCRTLHDITRFCHEKAVHEMFRFGRDHRFPERSSKQLRQNVPMQWWVLNLDDGFYAEVAGPYVELDNIASLPMLALWEGITVYPWEGPPPVDHKGFMSVMFQATANRSLLPTVRSSMANRNYFMISKHFCGLQSRLGFHFSTVEALVGDRTPENYISFHYKGGAADFQRRLARVQFVAELLEERGFRVVLRQDALSARMEQRDLTEMQIALKVIGYLSIHTRQLDMIMANPTTVNYYRRKIQGDLQRLGQPQAA